MGRKLDLSKLTDEEAQHVWDVIQRDLDLRKKEEERLEDLKGKVEKESTKRELISEQAHLNETHCVHCLQPFKFLMNSKRQCLDCHFFTCKNCSRYNKKEEGWVCDACRVTRVVKIGSLEWYYEHVRSRFKRFGSAKVMRSLYGRLQNGQSMDPAFLGLHDRFSSLPNINREYCRQVDAGMYPDDEEDGDVVDSTEAQRYSLMRKTKRLLSVHPFDFELDSEYSAQSRRQSVQLSPAPVDQDVFQSFSEYTGPGKDTSQKDSMIAEADLAAMFHHILQEQGQNVAPLEQEFSTEVRLTVNSRRRSLENTRRPESTPCPEPQVTRTASLTKCVPPSSQPRAHYSADMDTSEEEAKEAPKFPVYQSHHFKRRSRSSSQENAAPSGIQISELNKRMFAIERMLNRLEEKLSGHSDESPGQETQTDADLEEVTLKRKLGELTSNISDKGASSEEEEKKKAVSRAVLSSSSDDLPTEAQKVYLTASKTYGLERRLRNLEEQAQQSGTTDSDLSELEVGVASAAALVQHTESEVSDIESRIAALSAAGLTVTPADKPKRKSTLLTFTPSTPMNVNPLPSAKSSQQEPLGRQNPSSSEEAKVISMQQALRRKFNMSLEVPDGPDGFGRNALYRGSLTQRNPNGKNKKVDQIFAKPVLTHR